MGSKIVNKWKNKQQYTTSYVKLLRCRDALENTEKYRETHVQTPAGKRRRKSKVSTPHFCLHVTLRTRANRETAYRLKIIADSVNARYTRMQQPPFLQVIPLLKGFARTSQTSLEKCLHRASTCCRDFCSTFGFSTFDSLFKSLSNCFSVTYNHARSRASNFIVSVESHERIRVTLIRFTAAFILLGAIYLNISVKIRSNWTLKKIKTIEPSKESGESKRVTVNYLRQYRFKTLEYMKKKLARRQ
ncbi:hypothetical protein HELRODRAFT_189724 [Helobdella robusta]|uniref:Uncharacterized protein n=1 Tax=Helobdella robusta TaxID=6412 RepID=T1FRA8_HELRO|nr:hypothetical protein HELRODRAFT_189724 [Helobdella robusta]ESN91564.1 hypothetical protein HELRODRAFT_189724 [Helobdella robusta]